MPLLYCFTFSMTLTKAALRLQDEGSGKTNEAFIMLLCFVFLINSLPTPRGAWPGISPVIYNSVQNKLLADNIHTFTVKMMTSTGEDEGEFLHDLSVKRK